MFKLELLYCTIGKHYDFFIRCDNQFKGLVDYFIWTIGFYPRLAGSFSPMMLEAQGIFRALQPGLNTTVRWIGPLRHT